LGAGEVEHVVQSSTCRRAIAKSTFDAGHGSRKRAAIVLENDAGLDELSGARPSCPSAPHARR
jgi:hypothetical protein